MTEAIEYVYLFEDLVVTSDRGIYSPKGYKARLSDRQYQILLILIKDSSRYVSEKIILEKLKLSRDTKIHNPIHGLRQSLGEGIIETKHGKGYRFVAQCVELRAEDLEEYLKEKIKTEEKQEESKIPRLFIGESSADEDFSGGLEKVKFSDEDLEVYKEFSKAAMTEHLPPLDNLPEESDNASPESEIADEKFSNDSESEWENNNSTESNCTNKIPRFAAETKFGQELQKSYDETISFEDWLSGRGGKIKPRFIVCLTTLIIIIVTAYFFIFHTWNSSTAQMSASIAHIFIMLAALFYCLFFHGQQGFRSIKEDLNENGELQENIKNATGCKDKDEWRKARWIAEDSLKWYLTYWLTLIVVWIGLYIVSAYRSSLSAADSESEILKILFTASNNCNTLMIFLCFGILNRATVSEKGENRVQSLSLLLGFIFIVVLSFAEAGWLNAVSDPNTKKNIIWGVDLGSGVLGAVAMALYIGRFQSKFLKPSTWLIPILYSYTAIQPLFMFFNEISSDNIEIIKAAIFYLALILKCLLFFYMSWLFQSGRLLFYLVRVRRTQKEVETDWQNFRPVLEKAE